MDYLVEIEEESSELLFEALHEWGCQHLCIWMWSTGGAKGTKVEEMMPIGDEGGVDKLGVGVER